MRKYSRDEFQHNGVVVESSWRSILLVTLPIVLTSLSASIMQAIDRIMVVSYSLDAFNAVSVSGNLFGTFIYLFIGITDTAEVFVGQYNGSKNYKCLAIPIWQMFYFSLATAVVFMPIAYFSDTFNLLPPYYLKDGVTYQRMIMYGGPLFPMFAGLAAFFVGQGRAKIVTVAVLCGSLLNTILNFLLIYGVEGLIPSFGVAGAAAATIVSQIFQNLILVVALCSKKNRHITFYSCKFNKKVFYGCIKIGGPIAISNFLVILAWYFVQSALSNLSKDEATIYSICMAIYLLVLSLGEGLSKATSTVMANMIGSQNFKQTKQAYKKFLLLAVISSAVFIVPFSIFPDYCLFNLLGVLKENVSGIYDSLRICLHWISVDVILESVLGILWGVLISGGDTVYPTMVYQVAIWCFVVIPTVVGFFCGFHISTKLVYQQVCAWLCVSLWLFYRRYKSMKWYKKLT